MISLNYIVQPMKIDNLVRHFLCEIQEMKLILFLHSV
jgi:hypothetical protein